MPHFHICTPEYPEDGTAIVAARTPAEAIAKYRVSTGCDPDVDVCAVETKPSWVMVEWTECPVCGGSGVLTYTEKVEHPDPHNQTVGDGAPWVCVDADCRAAGSWSADSEDAWPEDGEESMAPDAHAVFMASVALRRQVDIATQARVLDAIVDFGATDLNQQEAEEALREVGLDPATVGRDLRLRLEASLGAKPT